MPQSIESVVQDLSIQFAESLIAALRTMSLEEILTAKGGGGRAARKGPRASAPKAKMKGGRLARRSPADIEKMTTQIVALLKANKKGLRAEVIRAKLSISKPELASPIEGALKAKKITKKGQRRATTYFAR
jgi:hypothetical protein